MFRIQNWKQALGIMALGSVFTIIGMLLSPVTAQRNKFDTIQCRRLEVVDARGNLMVILTIDDDGGAVVAYGKDDKSLVTLDINEHGGIIGVAGKDGKSQAGLRINEHGGIVAVNGRGNCVAGMGITERGDGVVTTLDKNGIRQ